MEIKTLYDLNQEVRINPFGNIKGIIIGLWYDLVAKYFVRYFMDGKICESYFYEQELSSVS